ncbi:histidinol-phosphatase HisJ [Lactiplantibacillus plantarum]|uniref:histidinol-phosphatase HisJ n=1 Tax=Lactiplantibacillus plantarum TaxID=1590 RepID=UPI002F2C5C99
MLMDGHTHTELCPHGSGEATEKMIQRAIQLGFQRYCITEHAPLPPAFRDQYEGTPAGYTEASLRENQVADYLALANGLKTKYAGQIEISVGFEVDFLPEHVAWTRDFLNTYGPRTGDAQFAQRVVASLTGDEGEQQAILTALFDKQVPRYTKLIAKYRAQPLYNFLKAWPRLFGRPERIFKELAAAPLPETVQPSLKRLQTVVAWMQQTMPEQVISVDLSSQAPQKYYTGLTFRGYSQAGAGYLFSGGRYDKLLTNFQAEAEPAVGMGLDVDLLTTLATDQQTAYAEQLIYFEPEQWSQAEAYLAKQPHAILSLADDLAGARIEAQRLNAQLIDLTGGMTND